MQPISRRVFLVGSAAIVVAACADDDDASTTVVESAPSLTSPSREGIASTTDAPPAPTDTTVVPTTSPAPPLPADPFTLGVASGDPGEGSVVLWTRLAPDPLAGGGMPADDVDVMWEVALDAGFSEIRASGTETSSAADAHSVHVNAKLDTGQWYYRFHAGGYTSPVGLTRTAPSMSAEPEQVRFASASCQNYEDGYYTAHRDIAEQQPEFVVFLGDYIYEGSQGEIGVDGNVRSHGTAEVKSIDDYRNRYALYKTDPDLQAAHAACPWFVIWDDHEVENNYAGIDPQDPAESADFEQRRRAAYKAWWEHQPVALPAPDGSDEYRIYRGMRWGSLLSMSLLDGRQYRTDQACGGPALSLDPPCPETFDTDRTMLGDEQETWLFEQLGAGISTWNSIGQQTIFGDVTLGGAVLNYDQWDGYPVQRNRIVDRLAAESIRNVVVLTGDIHFAGTGTIRSGERGIGTPVGVEFVATSISSGGLVDAAVTDIVKAIPDIVDVELEHRGYIMHTVTAHAWSAEYRMVETVKEPGAAMFVHATYSVAVESNTATIVPAR